MALGRSYTENLEDGTKRSFSIQFIDWDKLENNDFYIVEEFICESEDGRKHSRPDIVLFINCIPFGVIECKNSSISIEQGISLIAFDINEHFTKNYKSKVLPYTAMLATNEKKDAVRYLRSFESLGDLKAAVIISAPDMREGKDAVDKKPYDLVIEFLGEMMRKYDGPTDYEETLKDKFDHGDLDLLIVVDKLLYYRIYFFIYQSDNIKNYIKILR